jgi:hypothetical protein
MVDRVWQRRGGLALAAAVVLVVGPGCLSAPPIRQTTGPEAAFIYGFLDVSGTKGAGLDCVAIVQDERVGGSYRQGCVAPLPEGLFWLQDAPPVRHNVPLFHVGNTTYSMAKFKEPFPVKEGELHLFGIYRYEVVSNPLLGNGTFALVPTSRPSHAEVLRMLLAQENVSERWKQRMRAKLKELGGKP